MAKPYPSKKAKKRAEYLKRLAKRTRRRDIERKLNETDDIEEIAKIMGVRLR